MARVMGDMQKAVKYVDKFSSIGLQIGISDPINFNFRGTY